MRHSPVRLSGILPRASRRSAYPGTPVSHAAFRSGPRLVTSSPQPHATHFSQPATPTAFISTSGTGKLSMATEHKKKNLALLEPHLTPALFQEIRDFWYEHITDEDGLVYPKFEHVKKWFMGGKELDEICVKRFSPVLEAIRASGATTAHDILSIAQPRSPLDWLSLMILLDQIPRNVYRGDQAHIVFNTFDPIAMQTSINAIEKGIPDKTPGIRWRFAYRTWFYMPLMHSEDVLFHERAVEQFGLIEKDIDELAGEDDGVPADSDEFRRKAKAVIKSDLEGIKNYAQKNMDFEKKHQVIIQQFGRYPHRNKALGREPTKEETEYLENGGDTFA